MKYMIMMFGGLGATLENRSPEWITSMHELMVKLDGELKEAGELVASQQLIDPSQATTVRFHNGAPVPTDGPFAEIKESLAGYWIVDVSEERALEIGVPGGRVHRVPDGGPADHGRAAAVVTGGMSTQRRIEDLLRELRAAGPRRAGAPARAVRRV